MKLSALFLTAIAATNAHEEQDTLDLLEQFLDEPEALAGEDLDEGLASTGESRRRRRHRHGPHGHNPHVHTPYPTPHPTLNPTPAPTTPAPTTSPTVYAGALATKVTFRDGSQFGGSGSSDISFKPTKCLVRTNFCGAARFDQCSTDSSATVTSKFTFKGGGNRHSYLKLFSDGTLYFDSPHCISVSENEPTIAMPTRTSASCKFREGSSNMRGKTECRATLGCAWDYTENTSGGGQCSPSHCAAKLSFGSHGHICHQSNGELSIHSPGKINL